VLWIKADSHACGDMKDKGLLRPADNAEEEEDARMVKARLNIPLSTVRILFAMWWGWAPTLADPVDFADPEARDGVRDCASAVRDPLARRELPPL
jgi:hypothetical protein